MAKEKCAALLAFITEQFLTSKRSMENDCCFLLEHGNQILLYLVRGKYLSCLGLLVTLTWQQWMLTRQLQRNQIYRRQKRENGGSALPSWSGSFVGYGQHQISFVFSVYMQGNPCPGIYTSYHVTTHLITAV